MHGGGSIEAQVEQISKIANSLNVRLTPSRLNEIVENLFGNVKGPHTPSTFREGKLGSWQQYFNEEHKKVFKEVFGDLQLSLGYSLD